MYGHSLNKNVFIYWNNYPENPEATSLCPFIMSKVSDSFSYPSSRFNVLNKAEGTGLHRDGHDNAYYQNSYKKVSDFRTILYWTQWAMCVYC